MPTSRAQRVALTAALAALAGCAGAPVIAPPDVPAALRPAAGQEVFLQARASGVQIYECAARPDQPAAYAWIFRAPEATLVDRHGRVLGKHYAGPTWEYADGSKIVGEKIGSKPVDGAIPLLLIKVTTTSGKGKLSAVKYVKRDLTSGGTPPTVPADEAHLGKTENVPYHATYVFYAGS